MKQQQRDFSVSGQIVDIINGRIFKGKVTVKEGIITSICACEVPENQFIVPGLVDAHIHIESSMLIPTAFAQLAVNHGTVATVSDPHEIANVLGLKGVEFMINNGKKCPMKFYFGAPSCVPATPFETSGATLSSTDIASLFSRGDIHYLSEMMNYPGVVADDKEVVAKLNMAKKWNKPIDGHAPLLTGEQLKKYVAAGITTDHECSTIEEAEEKIRLGMHILIREGSAAKNFTALLPLMENHADKIMFCSDDKHPDDLVKGHINELVRRAIAMGYDPIKVLRCATINPIRHYNLAVGCLQVGDPADLIVVNNLTDFAVQKCYIDGNLVSENGQSQLIHHEETPINHFNAIHISSNDLVVEAEKEQIRVIEVVDGALLTKAYTATAKVKEQNLVSNIEQDILKLVVVNRYQQSKPAIAFIHGFGLQKGAIASSIAHDSHNIVAVGCSDEAIAEVVKRVIDAKGGVAACCDDQQQLIQLPYAGLMCNSSGIALAAQYTTLNKLVAEMGSTLHAPFMTLSFMSLLVIPSLKLSDKGLFDGTTFQFVSLFSEE